MPWDFTTAPISRHLRFHLTVQGVTVQPYASGASDSASQSKQLRFHLTFQGVTIQPHAFGASNSASQPKQLRFRLTFPAVSTPLHSPSSLSPSSLNSASQSKESRFRLTTPAIPAPPHTPAITSPPHSTIQIKYSFPSSLIFCRDFWILMRILSGTPAILFSICSATIS